MKTEERLLRRLFTKAAQELGVEGTDLEDTVGVAMKACSALGNSARKRRSGPNPLAQDLEEQQAQAEPPFPRRGDEDLHEATDTPIFLIQRRRLVVTDTHGLEWDSDIGKFVEDVPCQDPSVIFDATEEHPDRRELTDEQLIKADRGHWEWDTQLVAFTRKEAERYAKAKSYNGPFRVYSVPAMGELKTILRALTDKMLTKEIRFFGQRAILACDGKCEKAWGLNNRPREQLNVEDEDDFAWLADGELGIAPADPGTYEGGHGKPTPDMKLESKWCARECERGQLFRPHEPIELRDFSQRFYNIRPHQRPK